MNESSRRGLVWEERGLGVPKPAWSYEPSTGAIEKVCREKLHIANDASCTVTYYAAGSLNKLYLVETPDHPTYPTLLMRVSLPVDPRHKTSAEVATLRWVRHNTDIPVPDVVCFDESNDNDIGFEWILMELMPGKSAYELWRRLTMDQKTALAERMAEFQAQLLNASSCDNLRGIGSLSSCEQTPTLGRIVDRHFFWGDRIDYPVPRGPFKSSHDWLAVHLDITIRENSTLLNDPDNDEDDREWFESIIRLAKKLLALLPKIFPSIQHPAERTFLWHDDLNLNNILLDSHGQITAVLDWEFLSCQPFWVSTRTPAFLKGNPREKKPLRDRYADADTYGPTTDGTGLDDEGKNKLFWIHLMEWETTQLRKVYDAHLERVRPDWETEQTDSALKVDFLNAATQCAQSSIHMGCIELWVDAVEKGQAPDLMEVLRSRGESLWTKDSDDEDADLDDDESDDACSNDSV